MTDPRPPEAILKELEATRQAHYADLWRRIREEVARQERRKAA